MCPEGCYKSLHRTRVIPVSCVIAPFRFAEKYYLTCNPAYSQTGKTGLVTQAQKQWGSCRLGLDTRISATAKHQLPSLSCWNLLVCWPSGCRENVDEDIFCFLHNKMKWATGFFKSYEPRGPTLGILCPFFGQKDDFRAESKPLPKVGHPD